MKTIFILITASMLISTSAFAASGCSWGKQHYDQGSVICSGAPASGGRGGGSIICIGSTWKAGGGMDCDFNVASKKPSSRKKIHKRNYKK